MTRRIPAMILLAIGAAACNRQAAAPPLPATRTSPPTATPSLTASPVPPSAAPTGTPGATATVTVPPLATDDPRNGLGLDLAVPDYGDGFAQRFTWGEIADAGAVNTWEDGRLKTSYLLSDGYILLIGSTPDAGAGDFFAEITAQMQACAGKDSAGFAGRISGAGLDSGYTLEMACDGTYRVRKFSEGAVTVLRDWTASDAIVKGPDAANRLGILARGDQVTPFANGVALGPAVQDASFAYGTFGVFAMARETPGVVVVYDDFALWYVTP